MQQSSSPFHPAELALQERFGRRKMLEAGARRGIRDHLIPQHRDFFQQLPFILAGSVDASGQPWASIIAGRPGFATSADPQHLRVGVLPHPGDPFALNLLEGAPVALLGIELHTRRRNRLNGTVTAVDAQGWTVGVVQSYGNCPQYIQARELHFIGPAPGVLAPTPGSAAPAVGSAGPAPDSETRQGSTRQRLSAQDRALISSADTFFIASANPRKQDGEGYGADVSHRGGRPGFVRIDDHRTLTVPDFIGNFFFNTIGNLQVNPHAGLLFLDFSTGDVLMLRTRTKMIWDADEVLAFEGAQRLLRFEIDATIRFNGVLPFRSEGQPSYARELARTGTWTVSE